MGRTRDDVRRAAIAVVRRHADAGLSIAFQDDMTDDDRDDRIDVEIMDGREDGEVVVVRGMHAYERGVRDQLVLTTRDLRHDDLSDRIERWLAPALEILREDLDARERGFDPLRPPLHVLTTHPVVAALIAWSDPHHGVFRVDASASDADDHANGRLPMGPVRLQRGLAGISCRLAVSRRRLVARAIVVAGGSVHGLHVREEDARTVTVRITEVEMPESVAAGLAGRRLGDAVDHPAFEAIRHLSIGRSRLDDGMLSTSLEISVDADPVGVFPKRVRPS